MATKVIGHLAASPTGEKQFYDKFMYICLKYAPILVSTHIFCSRIIDLARIRRRCVRRPEDVSIDWNIRPRLDVRRLSPMVLAREHVLIKDDTGTNRPNSRARNSRILIRFSRRWRRPSRVGMADHVATNPDHVPCHSRR
jgi:hypothetical protein